MGLLLMTFGLIFIEPFMYLLGSSDTILPYAKDYGMWVLLAAPFMICSLVLNNNLRYEGKAFYSMIGLVTGGLLNIFGDYMLIKVYNRSENRADIQFAVDAYRAKVVDYTTEAMCIEITGDPTKIDAFVELMKPFGIIEMCRTGIVALERGNRSLLTK